MRRSMATELAAALGETRNTGFRTPELAKQIAERRWRDVQYDDASTVHAHRPAHAEHRAQRQASKRPVGRRRLRPLPRLAVDVPRRPRRPLVGVPERLSGGRAWARQRDWRGGRKTGPDDRRRDRRRRGDDGARGTRDRSAAAPPQPGRADLQRRGVRGRGPPLRADGTGRQTRAVQGRRSGSNRTRGRV